MTSPAAGGSRSPALPVAALVLLVMALAYAVFAQGAFYANRFRLVLALLGAGLAAVLVRRPPFPRDLLHPLVGGPLVLGAWSIVSAALAHDVRGAGPALGLCLAVAAVVLIVNRLGAADRAVVELAVVLLGLLVAADGWYGVAWHVRNAALPDQGLWRAASQITYANGTAGLVFPLALFALARRAERPDHAPPAFAAYGLLVGGAATLSRAGALALLAGLVVLAVTGGPLRIARQASPILLAAAIATAGLLPSTLDGSPARPALALAGAITGGAVVAAAVLAERSARGRSVPALLLAVLALTVASGALAATHHKQVAGAIDRLHARRFNAASSDRADERNATVRLIGRRPIAGTGPGHFALHYRSSAGRGVTARFAHNEYLQLMAEEGAIGLFVLAVFMVATFVALVRVLSQRRMLAAGASAALVALAVHSAFDYLWHIPAVVLLPLALVAMTLASDPVTVVQTEEGERRRRTWPSWCPGGGWQARSRSSRVSPSQ